jgi:cohesin complex subunit SA-1/2
MSFRQRYVAFWEALCDILLNTEDEHVATKESLNTLRLVTDQLVSLSSMAVLNIRDAVTEAALTVGQKATECCAGLRSRVDVAKRQLQAEAGKQKAASKGATSAAAGALQKNPKYQAIQKQSARLEEALSAMEDLSSVVFNSVFVHRFKDSQESVRALCTRRIGDWLLTDPERLFKDDYIKYVGWMTFDHSAPVRREAVASVGKLIRAEGQAENLSAFVDRFIGRFIEIAVGDVDDAVALQMLKVMRELQV